MWIILALIAAASGGAVGVAVKVGMRGINPNLGTFLRTCVVLVFTFIMAAVTGGLPQIADITPDEWLFISASGLATGLSWLCYFRALQIGDVNKVVPVDKLSTVLTMTLAITLLGEPFWWLTFAAMGVMLAGAMLMAIKKKTAPEIKDGESVAEETASAPPPERTKRPEKIRFGNAWLPLALLSLVFASVTSVLAKIGMKNINTNLGTFLRTAVVLVVAFAVAAGTKKLPETKTLTRKNLSFLFISGVLTGVSWLAYYAAIQLGPISVVAPLDKLSVAVSVLLAYIFLKEKLSGRAFIGLLLLVGGTLLLLI